MTRSSSFTAGVAVCALLGAVDVIGISGLFVDNGPPAGVAVGGAVLGIITLIGTVLVQRDRRGGLATVVGSRLVSALMGIPVFFTKDIPGWVPPAEGVLIALTIVGLGLIFRAARQPAASPGFSTS